VVAVARGGSRGNGGGGRGDERDRHEDRGGNQREGGADDDGEARAAGAVEADQGWPHLRTRAVVTSVDEIWRCSTHTRAAWRKAAASCSRGITLRVRAEPVVATPRGPPRAPAIPR